MMVVRLILPVVVLGACASGASAIGSCPNDPDTDLCDHLVKNTWTNTCPDDPESDLCPTTTKITIMTTTSATTTAAPAIQDIEILGALTMTVPDVSAFLADTIAQDAVKSGIAAAHDVSASTVKLTATAVTRRLAEEDGRRLAGSVKISYIIIVSGKAAQASVQASALDITPAQLTTAIQAKVTAAKGADYSITVTAKSTPLVQTAVSGSCPDDPELDLCGYKATKQVYSGTMRLTMSGASQSEMKSALIAAFAAQFAIEASEVSVECAPMSEGRWAVAFKITTSESRVAAIDAKISDLNADITPFVTALKKALASLGVDVEANTLGLSGFTMQKGTGDALETDGVTHASALLALVVVLAGIHVNSP